MNDPNSRYAAMQTLTRIDEDGQQVVYLDRRFLPPSDRFHIAHHEPVRFGDRPDLIAARTLGDPLVAWRLADANGAMHPMELVSPNQGLVGIPLLRGDEDR